MKRVLSYFFCNSALHVAPEPSSPCVPSPCGPNAICKERNGAGSCTCIQDYIGNPYESCRPECVVDTDCPSNKACFNSRCQDPCPGTCGINADCRVVGHLPICSCYPGYTGDPFKYCNIVPQSKIIKFLFFYSVRLMFRANSIKLLSFLQSYSRMSKMFAIRLLVDLIANAARSETKQCVHVYHLT